MAALQGMTTLMLQNNAGCNLKKADDGRQERRGGTRAKLSQSRDFPANTFFSELVSQQVYSIKMKVTLPLIHPQLPSPNAGPTRTPPQPQGSGELWAEKHVCIVGEIGCAAMGVEERGVITVERAVDDWCHSNMNELMVTHGRLN